MNGISVAEVAKHFVNAWVFNYGPPKRIVSYKDGYFTSKFFQDLCRLMSIEKAFTTMYRPQTNGHVDTYN